MAQRQALVWPPVYDEKNRRIKGFYPWIVRNKKVGPLLDSIREQSSHPEVTRVSIRAVIPMAVLVQMVNRNMGGIHIEAAFPISHIISGCWVAYLSYNKPQRASNEGLRSIVSISRKRSDPMAREELERQTTQYKIMQIKEMNDETAEKFSVLFASMFDVYPVDINPSAIREMPQGHIVMAAYEGEELTAVFMADRASFNLEYRTPLTFFDFVNVVSKKDGLLLVPLMARHVVEIANQDINPIIYAEARADVPGLQICCIRAGMQNCGTLAASSLFKDKGDDQAAFRDTKVWFIPNFIS